MYDIDAIKEQFAKVISYSQGITNPKLDHLFQEWEKNKKVFIDTFGGLIYEYPEVVRFELSESMKYEKVNAFIERIDTFYDNNDLACFIEANIDGFFSNEVVTDYYSNIPVGAKLLKAFKHFEENKEVLDLIQTEASRIVQENKVEGKLCFSVHPLDYLSSSENTFNWRSCHSLDGEFRCGNLSYMGDASTVIVYLKDEFDHELPHFSPKVKWNSKKWRILLHFSTNRDMIFAGRQYPFSTPAGLEAIMEVFCKNHFFTQRTRFWRDWSSFYIDSVEEENGSTHLLNRRYLPICGQLYELESLIHKAPNSFHYDDLRESSVYKYPSYTYLMDKSFLGPFSKVDIDTLSFEIGSETHCLHCGNELVSTYDMMVCPVCDCDIYDLSDRRGYTTCDCCGRTIYYEDSYIVNDEYRVCEDCERTETGYCHSCGDRHWKSDLRYNRETGETICRWCEED